LTETEREFIVAEERSRKDQAKPERSPLLYCCVAKVIGLVLDIIPQLFFLFVADLVPAISSRRCTWTSCIPSSMQACRGFRNEPADCSWAGGWSIFDSQRLERIARPARTDPGTSFGLGIFGGLERTTPATRYFGMSISWAAFGASASVLVHSFFDRARGKCGKVGGILNFGGQLSAIIAPVELVIS